MSSEPCTTPQARCVWHPHGPDLPPIDDIKVHPDWAPLGAARFKDMIEQDFFKGVRFFRVVSGFMAQFGIHPKPALAAEWKEKKLKDDPVVESNKRGYISFATSGADSRTTQMFINVTPALNPVPMCLGLF